MTHPTSRTLCCHTPLRPRTGNVLAAPTTYAPARTPTRSGLADRWGARGKTTTLTSVALPKTSMRPPDHSRKPARP
eukprot:8112911-Alexandrium_andersonii.AAC.1